MGTLLRVLFHLFMIGITGGLWIIVLFILMATNKGK